MSGGIRIDPGALLAAGKRCEDARDALKPLLPDFERNAAPADGCFGLLERGGKELEESYQEFHQELLGFAKDLVAKLDDTATGLRESAERLGGG
ncbi:hypothetical protein [Nonomuraea sp. NPDC003201]